MKILYFFCLFYAIAAPCSLNAKEVTFVYEDYPPYEYSVKNELRGISVERVKAICSKSNLKARFVFAPWSRALHLVKTGEVDGIFSLNKTKEREEYMNFSHFPLAWSEERLYSRKDTIPLIARFRDLPSYSVGVVASYTYGKRFDDLIIPRKEVARDNENLIARLKKGWIDVVVMNQQVFHYYLKQGKYEAKDFVEHPLIVNAEDLYIAFSKKYKDQEKILAVFNDELSKMNNSSH